jgi:hypothetical protein
VRLDYPTPTQRKASERHRALEAKIAARAVPDTPIALPRPSPGVRGVIAELGTKLPRKHKPKHKPRSSPPRLTLGQRIVASAATGDLSAVLKPRQRRCRPLKLLPVIPNLPPIPIEQVLGIVAQRFNVRVFDLVGPSNFFGCFRDIAIYLAVGLSQVDRVAVGKAFNRHQATVDSVVRRVNKRAETDENLMLELQQFHKLILRGSFGEHFDNI